jgi:hypothetical protein
MNYGNVFRRKILNSENEFIAQGGEAGMLWNLSANRVRENIVVHSLYKPHYRLVVNLAYDLARTEELNVPVVWNAPSLNHHVYDMTARDVTGMGLVWKGGGGVVVWPPRAADSKGSKLAFKIVL